MTGDHHPLGATKFGAREDRIPVAHYGQVAVLPQRLLHPIGDFCLVAADRFNVDQCSQQFDNITSQVQRRRHERHPTASVGSAHD